MNCPNCGSSVNIAQQFCRSCGVDLVNPGARPASPSVLPGLAMAFGGIAIALFGRMVFHLEAAALIGVLISIAGMFYVAAYPYLRRSLGQKRKTAPTSHGVPLTPGYQTNKLPPMSVNDFPMSVTENTTDLLKVPVKRDER